MAQYDGGTQVYLKGGQYIKNVPTMPRGPKATAEAIEKKVKGWGDGAFGEIKVTWKGGSAHSILVMNHKGSVIIYDSQIHGRVKNPEKYFSKTNSNNTSLVRLDNAPIKSGVTDDTLNKMVRRRKSK